MLIPANRALTLRCYLVPVLLVLAFPTAADIDLRAREKGLL